ncbi:GNAT family N-acetyltransferase [Nodosilinea sp. AN01ver1]|uniref:GNAT family N-acetyltransferase n=1 Tax=Nodosilinea sp. AN01ver1 TaxID=3423362 RepID=UPI003D314105
MAFEKICAVADTQVWVAIASGTPVGFAAAKLHAEDSMGEIYMVAVDSDVQGQGKCHLPRQFGLKEAGDCGADTALPIGINIF